MLNLQSEFYKFIAIWFMSDILYNMLNYLAGTFSVGSLIHI